MPALVTILQCFRMARLTGGTLWSPSVACRTIIRLCSCIARIGRTRPTALRTSGPDAGLASQKQDEQRHQYDRSDSHHFVHGSPLECRAYSCLSFQGSYHCRQARPRRADRGRPVSEEFASMSAGIRAAENRHMRTTSSISFSSRINVRVIVPSFMGRASRRWRSSMLAINLSPAATRISPSWMPAR